MVSYVSLYSVNCLDIDCDQSARFPIMIDYHPKSDILTLSIGH